MDQVKIDNYIKENSGMSFPDYTTLNKERCDDIRFALSEKLNLNSLTDSLTLVKEVERRGEICDDINCSVEDFNLKDAFLFLGVGCPESIYINWYRYDDIDKMMFVDFANNFDDVWYPDVDDIDIFDETLTWVLSVTHYGQVRVLKIK